MLCTGVSNFPLSVAETESITKEEDTNMGLTIEEIARSTGFPKGTLQAFADRGWLPQVTPGDVKPITYDGFARLRRLEEVKRGR